jgi:hypothetical protein
MIIIITENCVTFCVTIFAAKLNFMVKIFILEFENAFYTTTYV